MSEKAVVATGRAGKWAGGRVRYLKLSITPMGRLVLPPKDDKRRD